MPLMGTPPAPHILSAGGRASAPQDLVPQDWILTEETEPPSGLKSWQNVAARRTFTLTNPDDPDQVLYWYADELPARGAGSEEAVEAEWFSRFGHSQQAWPALCRAWRRAWRQDGFTDAGEETINALATLARIFREATRSRRT